MSGFPDNIIIRRLGVEDSLGALTSLLHRAYAGLASQGLRYLATHQSEEVTRDRISQGTCYVAVKSDQIVGTILFKDTGQTSGCSWYDRPEVASLAQFAVEPGLQAQGLGRQLITLVEETAVRSGAKEIALDTAEPATHLVSWYTKLGYRFIEYAQWGHTNYRSVILSKIL
ncbi:GNAT family N-acetyltransferase [Rhizobium sp. CFBP 8762]|uniref:GNAT family N-acetyltransferase n=1 Tax=Rhizobium sp. CFBP 8762 TaxID=2775279 RepID=UPI00177BAC7D|nr:GNAT family N-acetyltransferase [Rhizobium sp. CFBP 8762]